MFLLEISLLSDRRVDSTVARRRRRRRRRTNRQTGAEVCADQIPNGTPLARSTTPAPIMAAHWSTRRRCSHGQCPAHALHVVPHPTLRVTSNHICSKTQQLVSPNRLSQRDLAVKFIIRKICGRCGSYMCGRAGRWEAKGGRKTKQIFPQRNIKYLFFSYNTLNNQQTLFSSFKQRSKGRLAIDRQVD